MKCFHGALQKQRATRVRTKLRVLCVITSIQFMITTTTMFVRNLHCYLRRLQRLKKCCCFFTLKYKMWSYVVAIKQIF